MVGAPRSGTTLLQLMIGAHSGFRPCAGETGIFTRKDLFDLKRRYCRIDGSQLAALQAKCTNIVEFFDGIAKLVTGGEEQRFVEKTPQHVLLLSRLLKWFPQARFVHIVRDGRDCYCSAQRNLDVPQRESVGRFARYWRRCLRARMAAGDSSRVHDVKYEDLVHSPEVSVSEVMRLLGENFEHQQLDRTIRADDVRSLSPAFARLSDFVDTASVGRWRSELSPEAQLEFAALAGDELRYYGYRPE